MHQRIENKLYKSLSLLLLQMMVHLDSTEICSIFNGAFQNGDGAFLFCSFTFFGVHILVQSTILSHPMKVSSSNRISMLSQKKNTTHAYKQK